MRATGGSRIDWTDIPVDVRLQIETTLGSDVTVAANQTGGFSPGMAARCTLLDGRRVFVKAVSPAQNQQACRIHRREAEVARALPDGAPAPRLRHVIDDGTWVVLIYDEIEGRQPHEPWVDADLDRVIPAMLDFGRRPLDDGTEFLQTVGDRYGEALTGWRRLAGGDGDPTSFGPEVVARVDRFAEIESDWTDVAEGDHLLHTDLRADNILLGPDRVWFVDWPWACHGAAFIDPVFFLPSVGLGGGPDPADVAQRYGIFDGVDENDVTIVLCAAAGFFVRMSLDEPPPGLPRLREFQRAQALVAVNWLLSRID